MNLKAILSAALALVCSDAGTARADMKVERFDAAPTASEIASFKAEIAPLQPGTGGNLTPKNDWAQHASGQRIRAMGLMYEMTHDRAILDRMLLFCDAVLASRNDLASTPVGGYTLWTGSIEPAWPNSTSAPIGTAGEQGDPIGHLGYCARLILETPTILDELVSVGDAHGYGDTYRARAQRFVKEADHSLDEHVLSELLDLSDHDRMYWAAGNPTGTGSVPWNQQVMFTYAFQNLATAHEILRDDAARATRYDAIVKASMDWFFSGEPGTAAPYDDDKGQTSYKWAYRPPTGVEDWSHSHLDIQGLYRAYAAGKYGITESDMAPLANTFFDVIRRGPNDYAGRVDGTDGGGNSAPTSSVRPAWYLAALFRPLDYLTIVSDDLAEGSGTGDITRFSYFLWVKCKLHPGDCVLPEIGPVISLDGGVELDGGTADAGGAEGEPPDSSDAGTNAGDAGAEQSDAGDSPSVDDDPAGADGSVRDRDAGTTAVHDSVSSCACRVGPGNAVRPEPAWFFGCGTIVLLCARRRRRKTLRSW